MEVVICHHCKRATHKIFHSSLGCDLYFDGKKWYKGCALKLESQPLIEFIEMVMESLNSTKEEGDGRKKDSSNRAQDTEEVSNLN